jgi:hypothetical protein
VDGDSTLGDDATVAPAPIEDAPAGSTELDAELQAEDQTRDATEEPPPATGDPSVDQATAEAAATFGEPLETRLAAYERAHRTLQDRLADVEG